MQEFSFAFSDACPALQGNINLRQPVLVYLIADDFGLVNDYVMAYGLASLLNCDDLDTNFDIGGMAA